MKYRYGCLFLVLISPLLLAAPLLEDDIESESESGSSENQPTPAEDVFTATDGDNCQPISLSKRWKAEGNENAYGYPRVLKDKSLELLPDNLYGSATSYRYNNKAKPPYEVRFEFRTFDDDGGYGGGKIWHSADGIRFFFLRDFKNDGDPMAGGAMGRSDVGGGYAVDFPLYGYRRARITDDNGHSLTQRPFAQAYTDGSWVAVSVTIGTNEIIVKANNLRFSRKVNTSKNSTGSSFGFSAATGAADSQHMIRNVCMKKL